MIEETSNVIFNGSNNQESEINFPIIRNEIIEENWFDLNYKPSY